MAVQIQGNGGTLAEVDGTTFRALRVCIRPADYGSLGSYAISAVTGTLAAAIAANSELAQFRWTDATRLAAVRRVRVSAGMNVAATAAALLSLEAVIARAFTAAGSGGTALTITGNAGKLRTSMGTTLLGELRVATTAALGAGTKTLDANGIGILAYGILTGAITVTPQGTIVPLSDLYDCDNADGHPVVLAQNEGVVVKTGIINPAAMTWNLGVTFRWSELAAY
jgi:hypothetical protein